MEKPRRPYSLFKRPTVKASTFIYYRRFRDKNGDYVSPVSTLQFSKAAARNWADESLKEGKIILPWFWDYEGEYIQRKIASRAERNAKPKNSLVAGRSRAMSRRAV